MTTAPAEDPALRVLSDDAGLVAVDKPPGIATSGRTREDPDCLQGRLERSLGRRVWVVHQLDKQTSGVNLFVTEKHLVEATRLRMVAPGGEKRYFALCHGAPAAGRFVIDAPIGALGPAGTRRGVTPDGRRAVTHVEVLARGAEYAALALVLGTGRTHQVRIHLAHAGHPLVGEPFYRRPPCRLHPRQALHAWRVTLVAPRLVIEAEIPADLVELRERLGTAN